MHVHTMPCTCARMAGSLASVMRSVTSDGSACHHVSSSAISEWPTESSNPLGGGGAPPPPPAAIENRATLTTSVASASTRVTSRRLDSEAANCAQHVRKCSRPVSSRSRARWRQSSTGFWASSRCSRREASSASASRRRSSVSSRSEPIACEARSVSSPTSASDASIEGSACWIAAMRSLAEARRSSSHASVLSNDDAAAGAPPPPPLPLPPPPLPLTRSSTNPIRSVAQRCIARSACIEVSVTARREASSSRAPGGRREKAREGEGRREGWREKVGGLLEPRTLLERRRGRAAAERLSHAPQGLHLRGSARAHALSRVS